MGNCLEAISSRDDVSLLRDSNNIPRDSSADSIENGSNYRQFQNEIPANIPVYYPSPNVARPATQLTEEEQIKIAQRMGLIQQLPTGTYDLGKKIKECAICMCEFSSSEKIRYLPCMHFYHVDCIDAWLMRNFTCPSCMEPVDAALLSTYHTG